MLSVRKLPISRVLLLANGYFVSSSDKIIIDYLFLPSAVLAATGGFSYT